MENPIEEIKNRLDVIEVVGSYLKLQKAGINYRTVCPFHSEKKPSFFVSPTRQLWHCFGSCGEGGDIFKFVMKIEGVEFGDALRILAQKAGVELKSQSPEYAKLKSERERLYEVCEWAAKFFEKQFQEGKSGKEAKDYLLKRGITEESLKKWRVGYAPDAWQSLSDFLTSKNYKKEEMEKAGLALTSGKGSLHDRFRGRIIFPIFDLNSQVIGFGGRVFKDKDKNEVAKYVNTPQTILYDKSRVLYGLDKAKVEIRKKDHCILVEGYVDVIMVSQAGFENVVSTSGTALTPFQLKILKRYTENLYTAFDMDMAGDAATKRGIDLAQAQEFNIKVIILPDGLDPADMVSKDAKEWEKRVEEGKSILDFYFETTFNRFDLNSADGEQKIIKTLLPVIKKIPNIIIQSRWSAKLANRLGIKTEDVEKELQKIKEEYSEKLGIEPEEEKNIPVKTRRELLEERLIILILKYPNQLEELTEDQLSSFSLRTKDLILKFKNNPKIKDKDLEIEVATLFNSLSLMAEIEEIEEKDVALEIKCCIKEINSLELKIKLAEISKEMKRAESENDNKKIKELTLKFNNLSKEKW
ncbi:MAG: DNA primase [Candidatus Nealsonbacteria bacterium]